MYGSMGGLVVPNVIFSKIMKNRSSIIASTLRNRSDEYKSNLIKTFSADCLKDFITGELKVIIDK